jgi:hypothetical protein
MYRVRMLQMWALCLFSLPCLASSPEQRVFQFSYEIAPTVFPAGEAVDLYIPLPAEHSGQQISEQSLQSSPPGEMGVESVYGNSYYHIHRPAGSNALVSASLRWTVRRDIVEASGETELSASQRAKYLAPNTLVPVGDVILQPILDEIHQMRSDDSPLVTARAIYDWVVDNVEYKKVGTGWGNGDTFWACNERYGNCTDFHALFISLARSEGIPARFEIGFPVPLDRDSGDIGGYHCWVQFHIAGLGWIPIDASEAAKHPSQRELLFGSHPADRIHFTTGRDLVLSEVSGSTALNYFIYPYAEIGGKPWRDRIASRFSFEEVILD